MVTAFLIFILNLALSFALVLEGSMKSLLFNLFIRFDIQKKTSIFFFMLEINVKKFKGFHLVDIEL